MKVLGLIIDKNLNFRRHLDYVCSKACNLFKLLSRGSRAQWGLNSEITRLIYLTVIEPTVLYASGAWAIVAEREYARKRLLRVTRQFAIMISRAHRTTSLIASVLLARVLPLTLRAVENATIYKIKRGLINQDLTRFSLQGRSSPYSLPHPAFRKPYKYQVINNEADLVALEDFDLVLYTDGSKLEGRVGCAVSVWRNGREVSFRVHNLVNQCSVYQAELCAIIKAAEIIQSESSCRAALVSDSRSALQAISGTEDLNPLVTKARRTLAEIEENGSNFCLFWVRAHIGIPGNERADKLAKHAALNDTKAPIYKCVPLSSAKYLIRDSSLTSWQHRNDSSTTGIFTRKLFPDVRLAYKILGTLRMNNLRAQWITGHGGFRQYLFRFKLAPAPYCTCDDSTPETSEHVIFECLKFHRIRFEFEQALGFTLDSSTIGKVLNNSHNRDLFVAFADRVAQIAARANGSTV